MNLESLLFDGQVPIKLEKLETVYHDNFDYWSDMQKQADEAYGNTSGDIEIAAALSARIAKIWISLRPLRGFLRLLPKYTV